MAGTLAHITLADLAAGAAQLDVTNAAAIAEHRADYHLGAALLDLPYYEGLLANGVRLALGADPVYGTIGSLLHMRSPATFCCELLAVADSGPSRALALGCLTHLAVDLVFHHEIERRVLAEADGSVGLYSLHKRIEDRLDLHLHCDKLGHTGIGTPYALHAFWLRPVSPWLTQFSHAYRAVHGTPPTDRRLRGWLRSLALFGALHSSRLSPWVVTFAPSDTDLAAVAIRLADEAIGLAKGYLVLGAARLRGELDNRAVIEALPDINLLTGGPAEPPR